MTSFTDPAWLAEVQAWIESHVDVTGPVEQPHVEAWGTALRVPAAGGVVWFKAARDAFAFEPRLIELVAPLAPDLLPELIATRPEAGWMLTADAGERVRERPIEWAPLLRRYAELQIAAIPLVGSLLEAGVTDNRAPDASTLLPHLSEETARGLRKRLPEVERVLARLAESPLPPTLDQGDLHDANVFVRDGHVRVLDWGDAAVAHPFATLALEMDESARAAYLEPWTAFEPLERLQRDVDDVVSLRRLVRALNYARVVPYDPEHARLVDHRVAQFLAGE